MTVQMGQLVDRLHATLIEEIRARRPQYLREPFTVAEIYQDLVPYRSHRDRIGASMNGDYEHALLRLLAGEGGYLVMESEPARRRLAEELESPNPNTGVYREYAALDVTLNPARIPLEPAVRRTSAEPAEPDASRAPASPPEEKRPEPEPARTPPHGDKLAPPEAPEPRAEPPRAGPPRAGGAAHEAAEARTRSGRSLLGAADAPDNCRWCREELPRRDTLRFCPFCGTDVHLVPCPNCSEELEPEWRFCIACGTQVATEE